MPFIRGGSAHVMVGSHNLTPFTNNCSVRMDAGLVESTVFGELYRDFQENLQSATVNISGFFDDQAYSHPGTGAGSDDIVSDRVTSISPGILALTNTVDTTKGYAPITVAWAGNTGGNTCFVGAVASADYETGNDVGGLTSFAANYTCTRSWVASLAGTKGTTQTTAFSSRGVILAPLATYSSGGFIGTEHDNGASSLNGVIINLHGQFIGSSGTCTVRVEHSTSPGGVGATTVATFSDLTTVTGPYGQSLIITGTINRYVRAFLVSSMTGGQTLAVSYARL
ncbi:MAG: hypothetical protein ACO3EZ_03290 [Prochlorotrichaceae cyanobacterium]